MWTRAQAVKALRQVVSVAGVQAEEYALHSLRIGGATHLSAGGADPEVLKRGGRWASGAYKAYTSIRSHGRRRAVGIRSDGKKRARVARSRQGTMWENCCP